ncbi:MAG: MATE family efflux transporter [Acidiferrobacterales bacterium]
MRAFLKSDRARRVLVLALPVIGGMVSQNILNLVDTAMVGTLGNAALAAVGIGGFAAFMAQSLILGVATGVQAMAARRKGELRLGETAYSLNGGLLLVWLAAPVLSVLLYFLVPYLYPYINSDPDVIAAGTPYLEARVLAIVFVGSNFAFRGYWNAVDLSRLYMWTLVVMHSSNIFLNYVLIFGNFGAPVLGVEGAGIATALSTVIGTIVYLGLGLRYARENGFLRGLPTPREMRTLIRLSVPNGIQQLFFSAGFMALYWIIGQVGTPELAAANVLINVMLVAFLPGIAMGLVAATLVGQALGRKDADDAAQWGWDVVKVALLIMGLLGIPMWVTPGLVLHIFIHDPPTLELALLPMQLTGFLVVMEAVGMVLMNALLGAGDNKRVMKVAIGMQWLVFLPLAWLVGPGMGYGLIGIWLLQGVYRAVQATVFASMWKRHQWSKIKV